MANNVLLPIALAIVLYARGAIASIQCPRPQREGTAAYLCTADVQPDSIRPAQDTGANLFKAYLVSIAVVTLVTLLITVKYRISMHAIGIGGLMVLVIFMIALYHISMVWQLFAVVLAGGAVMSSRIYLGIIHRRRSGQGYSPGRR
jgi:hypothetical protein